MINPSDELHRHHPSPLDAVLAGVEPGEAGRLRSVWDLAGTDDPVAVPAREDVEAAWESLDDLIEDVPARRRPRPLHRLRAESRHDARNPRVRRRVAWSLAVALPVFLAVGVTWWLRPVVETAPPGRQLRVELPDGSRVVLNSGASIRFARRFGDVRRLELEGEAFFDVVRDARPFVVHTFNAWIRVVGTSFNVRAWPTDVENSTTVTLDAGSVLLAPTDTPERAVLLDPGDTRRVVTQSGRASVDSVTLSVDDASAWRRGDLVFKDQGLGTILDEAGRRFAVTLRVQPAALRRTRLSLALRRPAGAEDVVRDLAGALALRYRPVAGGFELYETTR